MDVFISNYKYVFLLQRDILKIIGLKKVLIEQRNLSAVPNSKIITFTSLLAFALISSQEQNNFVHKPFERKIKKNPFT